MGSRKTEAAQRRPPPVPARYRTRNKATLPLHPADASARSQFLFGKLIGLLPLRYRDSTRDVLVLMRMDRPVGALLLLWPTLWALWLAAGDFPPIKLLVIFVLGVFVMRSAGCVMNDFADRRLDPQVARTIARPIAAGRISPARALLVFLGLLVLALILVAFTNRLTIELAPVGVALAIIYPFCKRFTHLAQVVLGAAFGWSIPMAFAAVSNHLPPLCWLLFLANILYSTVYDTEYAMVDREEDIKAGSKSTAILFADADVPIIGMLMVVFMLAMVLVGSRAHLTWPYWLGVLGAAGLCGWQLWLIRDRSREHCFAAFRNNIWVGGVLWAGILLALAL